MTGPHTDKQYISRIAHHEAGYAVALLIYARELGYRDQVIRGIRLDVGDKGGLVDHHGIVRKHSSGVVSASEKLSSELVVRFNTRHDRLRVCRFMDALIVAALAGPTAELVFIDAPYKCVYEGNPQSACGDLNAARTYNVQRKKLGVRYKSWRSLYDAALPLVQEHWPIIHSLASVLVDHGEMDGKAVEEFITSRSSASHERLAA